MCDCKERVERLERVLNAVVQECEVFERDFSFAQTIASQAENFDDQVHADIIGLKWDLEHPEGCGCGNH